MIFDVITIFPEFFSSILEHGLLKRARASGHAEFRLHDLRDYTEDRHRTVDDRPFGGGPGMVFKPEPIFRAVETLNKDAKGAKFPVILLSPQGRLLTQAVAQELARESRLALVCGRYEGVDERVAEHLATGNRPDAIQKVRLGAGRDGKLTAMAMDITAGVPSSVA